MSVSRRSLLAASPVLAAPSLFWLGSDARGDESTDRFVEVTAPSRESFERGTAWAMKTFNRDGGCGQDIGLPSDVSCSAAVGLALLSQGNTAMEGPHARRIRGLAQYLVNQVQAGSINNTKNTSIKADLSPEVDFFFTALFLSQILGEDRDASPMIRMALLKLVQYVSRSQRNDGHWGMDARSPHLGTVMGWLALRGAYFAGFKVEGSAVRVAQYLIQQMKAAVGRQGRDMMFKHSAGIRVLYSMSMENEPIARKAFDDVIRFITRDYTSFKRAGGEEYLSFHLVTDTMLKVGGSTWKAWYQPARDKIIDVQNSDGSWTGYSCINSRTFCTAMTLLSLTAPNRYLPISQP